MSGCVAVSVTRNKALDGGGARISSDCYLVHVMSLAALTPTSLPASLTTTCKLLDAGGAFIEDGGGIGRIAEVEASRRRRRRTAAKAANSTGGKVIEAGGARMVDGDASFASSTSRCCRPRAPGCSTEAAPR